MDPYEQWQEWKEEYKQEAKERRAEVQELRQRLHNSERWTIYGALLLIVLCVPSRISKPAAPAAAGSDQQPAEPVASDS